MPRTKECMELARQLRAKWDKRNVLMASQSEEFRRVDKEVAQMLALLQETCGKEAQSIINEIWSARV